MKKYRCLCCGNLTLAARAEYDICPVCFWEDDAYLMLDGDEMRFLYYEQKPLPEDLLNLRSGANHGLTLKEGQQNYKAFGACKKEMIPHVRKPKPFEKS